MYARPTGTHEYLTVIPMGNWRSFQFGTGVRRLTLHRYIVMVFHYTAVGPHRGRERTYQAIQDAGLWWPTLFRDVSGFRRNCQICRNATGKPLVTGHQRTREYDGPFRFLMIDFVGPMSPLMPR